MEPHPKLNETNLGSDTAGCLALCFFGECMKVKDLIEALLRLPQHHELTILRDTNHGRVEYEWSHLEIIKEIRPEYELDELTTDGGIYKIRGVEETEERCIMVLS